MSKTTVTSPRRWALWRNFDLAFESNRTESGEG